MKIKIVLKKFINKIINFSKLNSDEFCEYLKYKGIKIGVKTVFFDPSNTVVDTTRPWMLEIGDYVKITSGCIILSHDYSRSVLRRSHGVIIADGKNTIIGNNVFLGMNSIILPGSKIGNNVIIGAGSVVSGFIPDNVVAAGNPCKIIRTMNEHFTIRKSKLNKEAKNVYNCYFQRYNKKPTLQNMGHFFPLYLQTIEEVRNNNISLNWSGDEIEEIKESFLNSDHPYKNFEDFINRGLL